MNRSAAAILSAAGVNPDSRFALQTAKIHEDLAYRLSLLTADWVILTLATADGSRTEETFDGAHALRKARGRVNRLKRGEETLTNTNTGET